MDPLWGNCTHVAQQTYVQAKHLYAEGWKKYEKTLIHAKHEGGGGDQKLPGFLKNYYFIWNILLLCFVCMDVSVEARGSEDNSQKLLLSFHHVGLGSWTQVIGLGGKCLNLLNQGITIWGIQPGMVVHASNPSPRELLCSHRSHQRVHSVSHYWLSLLWSLDGDAIWQVLPSYSFPLGV